MGVRKAMERTTGATLISQYPTGHHIIYLPSPAYLSHCLASDAIDSFCPRAYQSSGWLRNVCPVAPTLQRGLASNSGREPHLRIAISQERRERRPSRPESPRSPSAVQEFRVVASETSTARAGARRVLGMRDAPIPRRSGQHIGSGFAESAAKGPFAGNCVAASTRRACGLCYFACATLRVRGQDRLPCLPFFARCTKR